MSPVVAVVTVTAAGTQIQLSTTSLLVAKIRVQPVKANTGRIGVGIATIDMVTVAGLIADLAAPGAGATGVSEAVEIESHLSGNPLDLSDYWLDATVSGEKALVTYWKA